MPEKSILETVRRRRQRGMALAVGMLAMLGIFSLVLIGVLGGAHGGGLLGLTENGDQSASRQMQATAAFNIAESGFEYTLEWMHNQGGPPNLTKATLLSALDTNSGGTYNLGGGTFTVWIFPDVVNQETVINTNGQETPKRYLIQSTGLCNGISQTVQAYVSLASFGKYAFFTDRDPSNIYWVGGLNSFDGPTHFNGSDGVPTNVVWVDNKPIFNFAGNEAFTYSQGVNWYHNSSSSGQQAPQVITNPDGSQTDQFLNVAKIGSPGVNKIPPIGMPASSLKQQYAALGQLMPDGTTTPPSNAPGASSASGVTVTPGGGIYIHSANSADTNDNPANSGKPVTDVQQMVLSVDGSGNQVITIQQPNDAGTLVQTQITLDRVNNQTHITSGPYDSSSQTYTMTAQPDVPGVTNGVIYSDGNIGSTGRFGDANGNPTTIGADTTPGKGLSGVIADNQALTISTYASPNQSDRNNKNVNLDGSVTYNTPRAKNAAGAFLPESDPANATFLQKAGTLGLVADSVQLGNNNAAGQPLGDTELDATTLVQNTLQTVDYATYYVDQNSSNNIGSGKINGQTYYAHWLRQPHKFYCMGGEIASVRGTLGTFNGSTLQMVAGFGGNYSYDNRLANNPPPFFPTTSNQYQVLSWQRVAAPL